MIHLTKKNELVKVSFQTPYILAGEGWSFDDSLYSFQRITNIFVDYTKPNVFQRLRNYWCGNY